MSNLVEKIEIFFRVFFLHQCNVHSGARPTVHISNLTLKKSCSYWILSRSMIVYNLRGLQSAQIIKVVISEGSESDIAAMMQAKHLFNESFEVIKSYPLFKTNICDLSFMPFSMISLIIENRRDYVEKVLAFRYATKLIENIDFNLVVMDQAFMRDFHILAALLSSKNINTFLVSSPNPLTYYRNLEHGTLVCTNNNDVQKVRHLNNIKTDILVSKYAKSILNFKKSEQTRDENLPHRICFVSSNYWSRKDDGLSELNSIFGRKEKELLGILGELDEFFYFLGHPKYSLEPILDYLPANAILSDPSKNSYHYINRNSIVLGVYSTLMTECLNLNIETYFYSLPRDFWADNDLGANIVDSKRELLGVIRNC